MSYEIVHVYLGSKDPDKVKAEIEADARSQGMKVSPFLFYCYKMWKQSRQAKKEEKPEGL